MSNLTRQQAFPQMRCLPLHGITDVYRYVQMVNGVWVPINHIKPSATVGDITNELGEQPCEFSTGGSPTNEVYPSELSAGSLNQAGLSTFGPVMNMVSASVLSSSSSAIFGK
ncbi:hypothetical protein QU24_14830 [Pantoea rodasii]|uniref:Uncharacterized protein n=2 Tax=Pantoea TaxID=53335 RepID=A0A0U3UNQ8_9GAMM|nr:hypothetical protein LK04_04955 [Pantoea vagans]KHJ67302.1 hypothetical protein QU24_14830 [Pantoea rodasii]